MNNANRRTRVYKYAGSLAIILIAMHNLNLLKKIRMSRQNPILLKSISNVELASLNEPKFQKRSSKKVAVDKQFMYELGAIFGILIPKYNAKSVFLMTFQAIFLIIRTYLSVLVAKLDGIIVKEMINKNLKGFVRGIGYWFLISIPATYTNSIIKYFQSKISISFRTSLVNYCQNLYLSEKTYYKINSLSNEQVGMIDQYFTNDISKFCDELSALFSNVGKPTLDLIIFNLQLAQSIGKEATVAMFMAYIGTVVFLRKISPKFGKLAAKQAHLNGEYRNANNKITTNAEEIAFYNGGRTEHTIVDKVYSSMSEHLNSIYSKRIVYNLLEDFVIKYCWGAAGLVVCSLPVFYQKLIKKTVSQLPIRKSSNEGGRTKEFITNKRLMVSLGDAGGRIMYSYKDLAELAGYTDRIYRLIQTLHFMHENKYYKNNKIVLYNEHDMMNREKGYNYVFFDKVSVSIPKLTPDKNEEVLVRNLKIKINKGDHILITGSNGVGKSAIARTLKGIWPIFDGELQQPFDKDIIFIPQRPYLTIGSLRDQIIYPDSYNDMKKKGIEDEHLTEILKKVYMEYIPPREGGLDVVKEWKNVFSGGEKQRINLARIFYHKPKFAVLDECTSAVSSDVEGLMYNHAKKENITLITISHRLALFKYHKYLLKIKDSNNSGQWELDKIETIEERKQGTENEISQINETIKESENWKQRLAEIKNELNLN